MPTRFVYVHGFRQAVVSAPYTIEGITVVDLRCAHYGNDLGPTYPCAVANIDA